MAADVGVAHATYLVEQRGAHYLFTVKANQRKLAQQLKDLPWKDIPVIHRDDTTGHGRREQRHVQVVTVNNLLFPHARQVLRIQRKRRTHGMKRRRTELLHDHAVVSVKVRRPDGRWGNLDTGRLFRRVVAAGTLYGLLLMEEVSKRLGLAREPREVTEAGGRSWR